MTPTQTTQLITLRQAGVSNAAIAQTLGVSPRAVASEVTRLVALGTIPRRPQGGRYPHTVAAGEVTPVIPESPAWIDTPPSPVVPPDLIPALLSAVQEVQQRLEALEQAWVQQASPEIRERHDTPDRPDTPPPNPGGKRKWTGYFSVALLERLEALAYERRMDKSPLMEQLLWDALGKSSEQRS